MDTVKKSGFGGVPADVIKLIAMVAMLIDHIGAMYQVYFSTEVYNGMRAIGRLAFPIFAFFIVEGYFHTRDVKRYLLRLVLFAIASEIPFDVAFFTYGMENGRMMYWGHQNVFVTLALGLFLVWLVDTIRMKLTSMKFWAHLGQLLLLVVVIFGGATIADLLGGDYNYMGVLLIILFYFTCGYREKELKEIALQLPQTAYRKALAQREPNYRIRQALALLAWLLFYDIMVGHVVESYGAVAVLAILFYNGEKGSLPVPKWVFYVFYPVHLFLLILIRALFF